MANKEAREIIDDSITSDPVERGEKLTNVRTRRNIPKPNLKKSMPPQAAANDDLKTEGSPEPPTKRQRRVSVHSTLWDAHGNNIVMVQVEDEQFALHSSWLAKHSTFFNRLFNGEDLSGDGVRIEKGEGGDIYHIADTTAVDFSALLSAMDNAINFHVTPPSFPTVASILRAATSLHFADFRTWAIGYLQKMWSKDLDDLTTTRLPFAAETIELAQKYDVPNLLHRAYYEILRTPGLIQPLERQSKQDDVNQQGGTTYSTSGIAQAGERLESDVYPLSAAQLHQLVSIRELLTECWVGAAALPPKSSQCTSRNCLLRAYEHWMNVVHQSGLYMRYMYDPICGIDALADIDWSGSKVECRKCLEAVKGKWAMRRQLLWEMLEVWLMTQVDSGMAQYDVPQQATLYVGTRPAI